MISKREVDLESSEWPLVDYKIQTITGKSSLKIVSLYKYSHAEEASAVNQHLARNLPLRGSFRLLILIESTSTE
jgi:hypothetical protein